MTKSELMKGLKAYDKGDYKTAFDVLESLAEKGNAEAQEFLGLMIVNKKDPLEFVPAHMWFNLAMANGREDSETYREALAKIMTPEQVAEAQKLAQDFVPKS